MQLVRPASSRNCRDPQNALLPQLGSSNETRWQIPVRPWPNLESSIRLWLSEAFCQFCTESFDNPGSWESIPAMVWALSWKAHGSGKVGPTYVRRFCPWTPPQPLWDLLTHTHIYVCQPIVELRGGLIEPCFVVSCENTHTFRVVLGLQKNSHKYLAEGPTVLLVQSVWCQRDHSWGEKNGSRNNGLKHARGSSYCKIEGVVSWHLSSLFLPDILLPSSLLELSYLFLILYIPSYARLAVDVSIEGKRLQGEPSCSTQRQTEAKVRFWWLCWSFSWNCERGLQLSFEDFASWTRPAEKGRWDSYPPDKIALREEKVSCVTEGNFVTPRSSAKEDFFQE